MTQIKLFEELERTYAGPADHAEEQYSYFNRSARPEVGCVRCELEKWFEAYPDDENGSLKRRFETEFESAFFELFLHQLLLQCAYAVVPHPQPKGTRKQPDFLAERGKERFYLEAALATDVTDKQRSSKAIEGALYDAVNSIECPNFFLDLKTLKIEERTQPSARKIKAFLTRHLQETDPDEIAANVQCGGLDALPTWRFEEDGIVLEVQPIPKSSRIKGKEGIRPIGAYPTVCRWGGVKDALRSTIRRKARKYGRLDLPYLIAVNSVSGWGTDRDDIIEALFGTEQLVCQLGVHEPKMSRARDGAFLGPHGPQSTRVSGVLVGCVLPWNLPKAPLELYHNPWATKPLCKDALPICQWVPANGGLQLIEGQPLSRILGLQNDWPRCPP